MKSLLILSIFLATCAPLPHPHVGLKRAHAIEYQMALQWVAKQYPNLDTSEADPTEIEIHEVKARAPFDCFGHIVHACFFLTDVPVIRFRQECPKALRHEFVHYILLRAGHQRWQQIHPPWPSCPRPTAAFAQWKPGTVVRDQKHYLRMSDDELRLAVRRLEAQLTILQSEVAEQEARYFGRLWAENREGIRSRRSGPPLPQEAPPGIEGGIHGKCIHDLGFFEPRWERLR